MSGRPGDGFSFSSEIETPISFVCLTCRSVPVVAVSSILLLLSFPRLLAKEPRASRLPDTSDKTRNFGNVRRIDFLGGGLLLSFCLLFNTALQQAARGLSWSSGYVLPLLILAGFCVPAFLFWERYVTLKRNHPEPVFPWRLCQQRICIGMIA